jgi:adenosylcobinamide kinase / adenosylcobinamide-phosphate guanylyltransferase
VPDQIETKRCGQGSEMIGKSILILGGVRSGKSQFAQDLASRIGGPVLFVATGEGLDEEMRQRIDEHKRMRPSGWRTVEAPFGIGPRVREQIGDARVVIVDCLTLLVSNVIGRCGDPEQVDAGLVSRKVSAEIDQLAACIGQVDATIIVVSNEVGMGLVPDNRVGRIYRDCLGKANRDLAQRADTVCFMVAGIPMTVKGDL